jgi:hypothetical protein
VDFFQGVAKWQKNWLGNTVWGNPPPLLAVSWLGNDGFSEVVVTLQKKGNVVQPLVMKNIIGENHREYIIDNESRLFQDLPLAACFK